jgi:hypothetical protein
MKEWKADFDASLSHVHYSLVAKSQTELARANLNDMETHFPQLRKKFPPGKNVGEGFCRIFLRGKKEILFLRLKCSLVDLGYKFALKMSGSVAVSPLELIEKKETRKGIFFIR